MKIELSTQRPEYFREEWPGHYTIFNWLEFVCGIPHILFMISTYKENGKPNACLHSWSSFSGDGSGFFAIMPGVLNRSHTYENIMRTKEFCVNFLRPDFLERCQKTISENSDETDEFAAGGFHLEPSRTIKAPRITESFLTLECSLEMVKDLTNQGVSSLIIGKVKAAALDEKYSGGVNDRYGRQGFPFNVHSPKNPLNAAGELSAIGVIEVIKKY